MRSSKKSKKILQTILFLLVFAGIILVTAKFLSNPTQAAWYDEGWQFRKAITVTVNSSASDIRNLETLLTIDTTGITSKLQSSCQDLRFTNTSGGLLNYYIDTCSNNSATNKVWVMLDLVPKNTTTYTLYMYYGNTSAGSLSNSTLFYDVRGLVGYWALNESSWTVDCSTKSVKDSSVTANDGASCPSSTGPAGGATGIYGKGGSFDGNDYINITSNTAYNTSAITVSAWVNTSVNNNFLTAVGRDDLTNRDWILGNGSTGTFRFAVFLSAVQTNAESASGFSTSAWHHLVGTYDGTNVKLYVDGINTATTASAGSVDTNTSIISIGARGNNSSNWNGSIDDVRIYNRGLSDSEALGLYASPNTITAADTATSRPTTSFASEESTPGPIANWHFEDASGTTAKDASSTGANGTLAGTTVPTWQTEDMCVAGKCLYFDGSSSKVTVANTINGIKSVSLWVRPNSVSSSALIDFDGGTHKITVSSGVVSATGFTSPTIYINGVPGTTISANSWSHIEITTGTAFNSTSSLTLGNSSATYLKGFMDEVKMYNYVRSAAQVQAGYKSGRSGVSQGKGAGTIAGSRDQINQYLSDGLLAYWKMDATPNDSSGNGYTLNSSSLFSYSKGKFGKTTDLFVDDYYNSAINGVQTIAFWIYSTSSSDSLLNLNNTNTIYVKTVSGVVTPTGFTNPVVYVNGAVNSTITTNAWNHVVITTPTAINPNYTRIGWAPSASIANGGKFDDFRYYNRVFTPSDVANLYNWSPPPISWYKLDDNNGQNVTDSSGNGNTATFGTSTSVEAIDPTWAQGKFGPGVYFDPSTNNKYIQVPTTATVLDNMVQFTWESWIYMPSPLINRTILSKSGNMLLYVDNPTGSDYRIAFTIQYSTTNLQLLTTSVNNLTANTWYHVAVTWDGTTSSTTNHIYINGGQTTRHANSTDGVGSKSSDSGSSFFIGNFNDSNKNTQFSGTLDDVRVYSYPRTQKQILEDMNGGHPAGGSPVGSQYVYYKFDEQQGSTAYNSGSGLSANGTITGATWKIPGTSSCKINGCLSFASAATDNVSAGNLTFLDSAANFSATMWLNPSTLATNKAILSKSNFSTTNLFAITLDNSVSSEIRVYIASATNDSSNYVTTSGLGLTTSTWAHLAIVYDGTQSTAGNRVMVYKNGLPITTVMTGTIPATLTTNTASNLKVGSSDDTATHNSIGASIDELKIYTGALSQSDVILDANAGSSIALGGVLGTQDNEGTGGNAAVGWFKFDDNTGSSVVDSSGNGNTGTWNGTLGSQWITGRVGSAGNFNGSNNYVALPNDYRKTDSAGTIEAWVKFNGAGSANSVSPIVSLGGTATGSFVFSFRRWETSSQCGTNHLELRLNPTVDKDVCSSDILNNNQWYHVAVTSDGSTYRMYINGQPQTVTVLNGLGAGVSNTGAWLSSLSFGQTTVAQIGTQDFNGANASYTNGVIDDVRIFNYARSQTQISYDYNRGAPVAWYKFDECQGDVAFNAAPTATGSGSINNGTITVGGSGTYTSLGTCNSGSGSQMWSHGADNGAGKINYALGFDGTDDYVTLGNTPSGLQNLSASDFSVCAWIYPHTMGGGSLGTIIDNYTNDNGGWSLLLRGVGGNTNALQFSESRPAGQTDTLQITNDNVVTLNTWQHVCAVYTKTNNAAVIYKNGMAQSLATNNAGTGTSASDASNELRIGNHQTGTDRGFDGLIDDLRVYNYGLTSSQIKKIMNNGSVFYGPSTGSP